MLIDRYVVLDEAHRIKDEQSKLSLEVRAGQCDVMDHVM